ncbi:hypothetical protein QIH01_16470 [Brevibacillus brevis]|nr:hypothetical protein [Brevibacillus sp. HB2.2]NRS51800.1 hypothetical protein [Brevibacillus sp. HB2.2]WGV57096.1 hypothetical protein QIH01_16470 [Brevibacillus brevis]
MERVKQNDGNSTLRRPTEDPKLPEAWLRFLEAVQQQFSDNQTKKE